MPIKQMQGHPQGGACEYRRKRDDALELVEIFKALENYLIEDCRAITATIIGAKGSTPRKVGAKMLLGKGKITGTIGGGCAERQIFGQALHMLDRGGSRSINVDLNLSPDAGSEMICGGRMEVFLDSWDTRDLETASTVRTALEERKPVILVTRALGDEISRAAVFPESFRIEELKKLNMEDQSHLVEMAVAEKKPVFQKYQEGMVCIEPMMPSYSLIIAGAGHIARPLASIGGMLGFYVIVIDDREYYANPERFPTADRIIAGSFREELSRLPIDSRTYVVLLTRGHSFDEECLRAVIGREAAYIGMIGSRLRVRSAVEKLKSEGYTDFERLYAPVGIDIGAETPEEIALCIAAEIEMIMKGGTGCSLSRKESHLAKTLP